MSCSLKTMVKEEIVTPIAEKISRLETSLARKLSITGESQTIRLDCPIDDIDILSWLNNQEHPIKVYWSDRDRELEVAGVGVADVISGDSKVDYQELFNRIHARLPLDYKNLRYYGGISFSNTQDISGPWKALGSYRFILPEFEIQRQKNGNTTLGCNLVLNPGTDIKKQLHPVLARLHKLTFTPKGLSGDLPELVTRENIPEFAQWASGLKNILKLVKSGELEKVVLARKTDLKFDGPINPYSLLKRIKQSSPNCFHYCIQTDNHLAFIGASPERLYKREGNKISVEALAGTRARGQSSVEDQSFGKELMSSEKDHREHQFVVENLKKALNRLGCFNVGTNGKVSLLKLNQIQHLFLGFKGIIPETVTEAEIMETLHPTPAVGGCPTDKALEHIRVREPFCRGWYAGPIGWLGIDGSEFAVAIRSGLINHNQMDVYTGAGIIQGSQPQEEWQEIENKFDSFIGNQLPQ